MQTKPNILIVDDDKSICKMIASLLEMEGYPHRIVTGGPIDKSIWAER